MTLRELFNPSEPTLPGLKGESDNSFYHSPVGSTVESKGSSVWKGFENSEAEVANWEVPRSQEMTLTSVWLSVSVAIWAEEPGGRAGECGPRLKPSSVLIRFIKDGVKQDKLSTTDGSKSYFCCIYWIYGVPKSRNKRMTEEQIQMHIREHFPNN